MPGEAERAVRVHAGVERVRRRAGAGGHEHAAHDERADGLEAAVAVRVVLVPGRRAARMATSVTTSLARSEAEWAASEIIAADRP